jgi:hypothetical protein
MAGRQLRCRCGQLGALLEAARITVYTDGDEPWLMDELAPGESSSLKCSACGWEAKLLRQENGYHAELQAQRRGTRRPTPEEAFSSAEQEG